MTPANQNDPNIIGFPFVAGKVCLRDDEFGGPHDHLEVVNRKPDGKTGFTLYLISGRSGEYRELGTLVDGKASEALFGYLSSIHRAYEDAGIVRVKAAFGDDIPF